MQPPPKQIYGSLDGAKVRIENRQPADEAASKEKWREMKVGCFDSGEPVPERQQTRRHRKKAKIGHQALHTTHMRYSVT